MVRLEGLRWRRVAGICGKGRIYPSAPNDLPQRVINSGVLNSGVVNSGGLLTRGGCLRSAADSGFVRGGLVVRLGC